jgi:hypothetical protein
MKIDEYNQLIEDCLMQFNFHKVHRVMEFLEWTWGSSSNQPTICQLKGEARRHLRNAVNNYVMTKNKNGYGYSSSGGFSAYANEHSVSLSFNAEEVYVEDYLEF